MSISYQQASGSDINRILDKIDNAVVGEPQHMIVIAMLAGAVLYQDPGIEMKRLEEIVKDASEWLATQMTPMPVNARELN